MKKKKNIKEDIYNIPNALTSLRVLLTVVIVLMVLYGQAINLIILIFLFAAFTDFLDGYFARKLKQVTNFGTAFDPVADRILLCATVLALILRYDLYVLLFLFTREYIALPAIIFLKKGDIRFEVKPIGKITMLLQSITVPIVLLEFSFAWLFIVVTALSGIGAGIVYFRDAWREHYGKK